MRSVIFSIRSKITDFKRLMSLLIGSDFLSKVFLWEECKTESKIHISYNALVDSFLYLNVKQKIIHTLTIFSFGLQIFNGFVMAVFSLCFAQVLELCMICI